MSERMEQEHKSLADFCADLWFGKVFILTGAVIGLIAAGMFMSTATPHYKSQMILAPTNPINGGQASSVLGEDNIFALRYLIQRVGLSSSTNFTRFETTYAGPSVAALLLKDPAIVRGLKADKTFSFSREESDWGAAKLARYIEQRVRLDNVGASAMRRMVYQHPDTSFGRYFLQNIHRITDELIRLKTKQQAGEHVRYLQGAIEETNNPEHKRAMTELLMEQERLKMLVSIESAYAANVIEPPASSEKAVWPDGALMIPVGTLIGALLGFVVFAAREAIVIARYSDEGREALPDDKVEQRRRKAAGRKYDYWYKLDSSNANDTARDAGRDTGTDAAE